jgi:anti-sigma B factor antagonist
MEVTKKNVGDVTVLEIVGRLDSDASRDLESAVTDLLSTGITRMLMDFGQVDYINSSGLRVLLMALQQLKKKGGRLHLCDIKDYMSEVFEISGYNEIFPIYPSQNQALAAFPGNS